MATTGTYILLQQKHWSWSVANAIITGGYAAWNQTERAVHTARLWMGGSYLASLTDGMETAWTLEAARTHLGGLLAFHNEL